MSTQSNDSGVEPTLAELRPQLSGATTLLCDQDDPAALVGDVPASLRELIQCSPESLSLVLAVNLETNAFHACRAFPARDGMAPACADWCEPFPDEDADPGAGITHFAFELDMWADLDLPRWPATYNIYAVMRERISPPRRVSVGFSDRMGDAAVTWYIGDQQRKIDALPVWPKRARPYPAYGPDVELAIPIDVGIVLEPDRVVVAGHGKQAIVRGAFRVPLQPQDRVRTKAAKLAVVQRMLGPKAVIPINLMLVADDRASLLPIPLAVPAQELVDVGAQTYAIGRFAIDLFQFSSMWRDAQQVHLHALCSDVASRPATFTILDASMIPRRDTPPRPQ